MTASLPIDVMHLSRLRRRIRLLTIVVATLGVAVIGLGTRLLVEQTTEAQSAIPAQVERVVDDYRRAYETLDKELMTELVTEEFRATDSFYRVHVAGNRRGAYRDPAISPSGGPINVLTAGFSHQFEIESGQAIVSGDGPWFVAVAEGWSLTNKRLDGVSTYVVVERDGELHVAEYYFAGLHTLTE